MIDTRFSVSVQIMMTLAYHSDELVNSELLASVLKTNATFVRKLVSRLVEARLVESFRGKGGGIKLAKSPQAITLKDIYLAATHEKPLVNVHKKPVYQECSVSCCIEEVLTEVVTGIEQSTLTYLSRKNLSDLMQKVSSPA
jgi:Rrf2 family protein